MKSIILISKTNIINQIFTLVSKKLSIDLKIVTSDEVLTKVDLILVDDEFKNNEILKYKSYCKKLVLITNKDTECNNFDTILKKPFLPSQLQQFLQNIKLDDTIPNIETASTNEQDEDIDNLVSFVADMSDEDIICNEDEYSESLEDETLVTKEELGHGGVLDKEELSKLFDLISDEDTEHSSNVNMDENDWVDLGDIIDKAIDDVNQYEFDDTKPIKLILNKYSMKELSPLFKKLDQNIIDKLIDGKEISLQLRLEK
ncbi:MAG: hypothetical protein KAJ49_07860 [Arcobacteraceae bacterium]|nr:hypothetical protein [Arcobacteraceae bacterium]